MFFSFWNFKKDKNSMPTQVYLNEKDIEKLKDKYGEWFTTDQDLSVSDTSVALDDTDVPADTKYGFIIAATGKLFKIIKIYDGLVYIKYYATISGTQGPAGDRGEDGTTPNITASATVDANVGTPAVNVVKGGTTENPTFTFNFSNIKGQKGDTGSQGATGQTGATPNISASATVDANVGTPSVNVVKGGTTENPTLEFNFTNMKGATGETGAKGNTGDTPNISASATVDANVGTPAVSVVKGGTTENPTFTFNFTNMKGATGERGLQGIQGPKGDSGNDFTIEGYVSSTGSLPANYTSADIGKAWLVGTEPPRVVYLWGYDEFGVLGWSNQGYLQGPTGEQGETGITPNVSASATVDANTGTPAVSVTESGTDTDPHFQFNFSNLKGDTGATPSITANATVDANVGTPSVNVVKSGTDANPVLSFIFSNLKGQKGDTGSQGATGQTGATPNITASATVDANTGTPAVNVVKGGTTENPTFTFNFSNIKGAQGSQGATGQTGATPSISASATVDANVGTPSVTVTRGGTDANPTLNFAFSNLKGQKGDTGSQGPTGPAGATFTYDSSTYTLNIVTP